MDAAIETLLRQGIAAAKAGQRDEARQLLTRVVESDERSELGWLWLSGVVDDPADIRTCLQNVLDLNPDSAPAKKGLALITEQYGDAVAPQPPEHERSVGQAEPQPAPPRRDANAVTTTTLNLKREGLERAAAQYTAAEAAPTQRPPTTRLRAPVFDPLGPGAPAVRPNHQPPQPINQNPPPPTLLMEQVAAPVPERPPVLPATPALPSRPAAQPAAAAEPRPGAPAEHPCPFCGAPTTLKQQRCTQCRQSLMVRDAPPARRSLALTMLGVVWVIGGVLAIVGAALLGVVLLLPPATPASAAGAAPSGFLAIVLAALLLFGLICIGLARGLWARNRAFFFLNIALIVVGVAVRVGLLLRGAALIGSLAALATRAGPWSGALMMAATVLPLLLGVLLVLLPIILTLLSYRDFFGPLIRFDPVVEKGDHAEHYNSGIGYRDRGMWYMAIQEWAVANRMRPGDRTYLHTLGLAYAQIRKLYPNSKAYLADVEAFLRGRKAELYAAAPELEQLNLL
ncbi:tetratricopeptide repeat protein [Kouleothrix sp.]|uniref:tetratricopeptide repeat protein n=1 Tax=Kouleothrix sp. TaxID=2779161 RepID=UPI00391A117E